jgi:zinc transport system substrate-binding protein
MRAILTLMASGAVAVSGVACGGGTPSDGGDGRIAVVASIYPLAEAARRIGGDAVEVVELTPPGVEPHDLELTPDDIEAIATADVVLYAGGGFQPAVEDALGDATGVVVDVTADVRTLPPPDGELEDEIAADPHVWLDPTRYATIVDRVSDALGEAAGDGGFADAARAFDEDLARLDAEFRSGLSSCESRLLVVNHAAFGYLAEAYDLDQEAISGLSPEAEPDPQRLAELEELVRSEGVRTVFVESLASSAVGETLATEAGVTTAVLDPLEGLTQAQVDAGDDYLSVMRANLEALRDGLGCR